MKETEAMAKKILVVDDDRDICEILLFNLRYEQFEVDCAHSAQEALQKQPSQYDLMLLDVMMEGMSGYKLAELLREQGENIPIIFLTAKNNENDMLTGFSVGGDDYITKPFSIKEVVARVKAVMKRRSPQPVVVAPASDKLHFGHLSIDVDAKEATLQGKALELTKTELELLILLAKQPERIFPRQDIIDQVWAETPYITERTVDVHIARLRKKLGGYASAIVNKSGYGYRFNPQALCE